jgi:putative endonuclease
MNSDTLCYLYFLLCSNYTIYTGITDNLIKRYELHSKGLGSKHTKQNPPQKVIAVKYYSSKTEANQQERKLKKYSKEKKLKWIVANCYYDISAINESKHSVA